MKSRKDRKDYNFRVVLTNRHYPAREIFIQIITSISAFLPPIPLTLPDLAGAKDLGPQTEARRVEKYWGTYDPTTATPVKTSLKR